MVVAESEWHRDQIKKMFQPYSAEMAAFSSGIDEGAPHRDPSWYLDLYWEEPSRHAYLLTDGGTNIGFCLVNRHSVVGDNVSAIAEFYVLPRYRRHGHGQSAAREVLIHHGSDWEISVLCENAPAIAFWGNLVTDVASGPVRQFIHEEDGESDRVVYRFNV